MTVDGERHTGGVAGLARAERTALEWIDTVATTTGTADRDHAYRLLCAWLHAVRDRLEVEVAAHLAAQLPLLLRGVWYDGWRPSQVPVKYGPDHLVSAVAAEARVDPAEARRAIPSVTQALDQHWSPGQTGHLLSALPAPLRDLVAPDDRAVPEQPVPEQPVPEQPVPERRGPDDTTATETTGPSDGIEELARRLDVVTAALGALLRGFEYPPSEEPVPGRATEAAHRAHRILLEQQAGR